MHSVTSSQSDTVSESTTQSQSSTTSQSHSTTQSEAWTTSGAETNSVADTASTSTTQSHADTHSTATSDGVGLGQVIGRGISAGMSVGVAPSFSLSNGYQWQDDPYILLTDIMRTQRKLLDIASREGAFYTDLYALARSEQGAQALMGLIPEAFHGTEDVVAGVQTRTLTDPEQAYIGLHARAFTPSTRIETIPEAMSGYADSTLLTMLQVAAYTAPGMFEQGSALTTQEETPAFAFYPDMAGEYDPGPAVVNRNRAPDRCVFTPRSAAPFSHRLCWGYRFWKIDRRRTPGLRDNPFLALPHHRFGLRTGLAQGHELAGLIHREPAQMEEHVDIRQLYPGSPRPLRWNILQVPQRIDPGVTAVWWRNSLPMPGGWGQPVGFYAPRADRIVFRGRCPDRRSEGAAIGEMGSLLNFAEVNVVRLSAQCGDPLQWMMSPLEPPWNRLLPRICRLWLSTAAEP